MATIDEDDEFYEIPLIDQRTFGAGLKRKRVQFVSSKASSSNSSTSQGNASAAERYLAIVLPKDANSKTTQAAGPQEESSTADKQSPPPPTCDVCKLPIDATCAAVPHEASLAHQVCLEHSYPPSSIDRNRKGLSILQAYGWDPDSRTGLGAAGEGMLYPIKPKQKEDRAGLAARDTSDDEGKKKKNKSVDKVEKKLNPKEIRKREAQDKRRAEKLAEMFYRKDDLEKYLGPG